MLLLGVGFPSYSSLHSQPPNYANSVCGTDDEHVGPVRESVEPNRQAGMKDLKRTTQEDQDTKQYRIQKM